MAPITTCPNCHGHGVLKSETKPEPFEKCQRCDGQGQLPVRIRKMEKAA